MYIYIYTHTYIHTYMYVYIYIYTYTHIRIERERERERYVHVYASYVSVFRCCLFLFPRSGTPEAEKVIVAPWLWLLRSTSMVYKSYPLYTIDTSILHTPYSYYF